MTSIPPPVDAQGYLENLMRAGQDAMKQFNDSLASVAGVSSKETLPSGHLFAPLTLIADLQREYLKQLWRFWNTTILQTVSGGAHSNAALAKGDKRFKDDAWHDQPYYELLRQSYLLGSKQLHDFVDGAQVDARTKLQLRFYAVSLSMR